MVVNVVMVLADVVSWTIATDELKRFEASRYSDGGRRELCCWSLMLQQGNVLMFGDRGWGED
jgi:hypothetical protein